MSEHEVDIEEDFTIECPFKGKVFCSLTSVIKGHGLDCEECKKTGKITVHISSTTTVEIEPPERDEGRD